MFLSLCISSCVSVCVYLNVIHYNSVFLYVCVSVYVSFLFRYVCLCVCLYLYSYQSEHVLSIFETNKFKEKVNQRADEGGESREFSSVEHSG